MGLTLFVSQYLPFSEPEVTILSPRTVLNIRFRPGQAYLFGKGGISPNSGVIINRKRRHQNFNFVEFRRVGTPLMNYISVRTLEWVVGGTLRPYAPPKKQPN